MLFARSPTTLLSAARPATMSSITSPLRNALGCIVYVSEGKDAAILQQLEGVIRVREGVALASVFVDQPYNRSNFCLVGRSVEQLASAAALLSKTALSLLDFQQHQATHPRLGAVDHISCHPLGSGPGEGMQHAASLAHAIGQQLGSGEHAVPVYLYAAAHPQQQQLADIRRALGYFSGASQGQWVGALPASVPSQPLRPDFGPAAAPLRSGVCCVGASPWIVNFNILLQGVGFEAARRIARAVSERGGGLRRVQAMALHHTEGVEIACNLLDSRTTPAEEVEARVRQLAEEERGGVGSTYRIGKSPEELLAIAQQL